MGTQLLNAPLDITWRRLAFSRDMVDTSFGDLVLPPKWRSSMAVYQYVVPEEQTAEAYPDSRIVYLMVTCSVTGWNPSEELRGAVVLEEIGDQLDDLQRSTWEAIRAEGWAEQYWPCLGAIVQLAIYPGEADTDVALEDFPFILNVEPKKRELYETRSETGEFLSGTSNQVEVRKGSTDTTSTEHSNIITGGSTSFKYGPVEAGVSVSGEWGTREKTGSETVNMRTTDSSRERRETLASSTSFNQLYQLLNAYHLGTNRCAFVVMPRPHTVTTDTEQLDFNLLDGPRKLEGIQDFFVVVEVSKSLTGLCMQASLDTGHTVRFRLGALKLPVDDDFDQPDAIPEFSPQELEAEDDPLPPRRSEDVPIRFERLVVTRRVVRACARFTEAGQLLRTGSGPIPPVEPAVPVVFESSVREGVAEHELVASAETSKQPLRGQQLVADQRNRLQRRIAHTMLSGFTAGSYQPRPFVQTRTARSLAQHTLRRSTMPTTTLLRKGLITQEELKSLGSPKTAGELFALETTVNDPRTPILKTVRDRLADFVLKPAAG